MSDWAYPTMEAMLAAGRNRESATVHAGLKHANWRVRYAAAIAAGTTGDGALALPLVELLVREDRCPLYAAPRMKSVGDDASAVTGRELAFADGSTQEDIDAWERRGRVKQAAILAIGELGVPEPRALELLHAYIVDLDEDYMIRAASGKAIRLMGDPASLAVAERASQDEEFCTRVEATKAVRRLKGLGNE